MTGSETDVSGVTLPRNEEVKEETYPLIGLTCLLGIFMHMLMCDPILLALGIHYTDEDNKFWEKQHPGTYLILLSFLMLLWRHGNPLSALARLFRAQKVYTTFFGIYMLLLTYMIARSGAKGISFLLDTQICISIAALVLSCTPASYCRKALHFFIAFTVVNSLIGIGEGILKERLFTFDPNSSVMMDHIFRASAWLGHPLNNAMFTGVMLFVIIGVRLTNFTKCAVCAVLCISLVAFGGRSALVISCVGLGLLGVLYIIRSWSKGNFSLLQVIFLTTGVAVIPAAFVCGLYFLISSGMGERLSMESDLSDSSAQARVLAWKVFDYMKPEEIVFGMAPARTTEIRDEMSQKMALFLIENPWILMFMHLGLLAFPVWFAGTFAFMCRLMYRNPLPLKIAAVAYFAIASTNNSFAVKGSVHLLALSAIILAERSLKDEKKQLPPIAERTMSYGYEAMNAPQPGSLP